MILHLWPWEEHHCPDVINPYGVSAMSVDQNKPRKCDTPGCSNAATGAPVVLGPATLLQLCEMCLKELLADREVEE